MAYQVERRVVERLEQLRTAAGMTEEEIGKKAFPSHSDSRRRYHGIKNVSSSGKPQRLNIADLVCLAQALGADPLRIIAGALDEVERGAIQPAPEANGTLGA